MEETGETTHAEKTPTKHKLNIQKQHDKLTSEWVKF